MYLTENDIIYKPPSNLENNCVQIFEKNNSLIRPIKRLSNSNAAQKTIICGCYFKRKQLWVLAILCLLFFFSFVGVITMWWTSYFDNYIISQLVLVNNTIAFKFWKDPPIKAIMKLHIFNYTNIDEFELGEVDKLHVEDVGPFVYEETAHKTNIQFHSNATISYQEVRSHTFREDLSNGRKETERLMVPNLSVLGAAAVSKESFYLTRVAVSTLLRSLNADPFLNLAAHRFIWGYDDSVFEIAKSILTFKKKLPFEKFGLLAARNGTSEDIITIHSGLNDYGKIAQIDRINGENSMNHWSTQDCNQIKGSDGVVYPIYEVRNKRPLNIYLREVCRRIPLVYKNDVTILNGQVNAYRYVMPDSIFDRPEIEPENQCYCDDGACSPRGIFNVSKCAFGAPASISFPHFYKADPALMQGVTGLKPNPEKHSSYIDIHPTLAFPMNGVYRLQINVQVKKSIGMSQLDMFKDDIYLPIAWIEAGANADDLPDFAKETIITASVTLPMFERLLKYGFLLISLISFCCIFYIMLRQFNERAKRMMKIQRIGFVYP